MLITVDTTYMTGKSIITKHSLSNLSFIDWVHGYRLGDFYTYLAFIGIISVWSVYGLACGLLVKIPDQKTYYTVLTLF